MVEKIEKAMENVKGKIIAILGLPLSQRLMILEKLPQWFL